MRRQVELFSNEDWKHYLFISFQRLADRVFGGVEVGRDLFTAYLRRIERFFTAGCFLIRNETGVKNQKKYPHL
jgi:hypothetical protein